MTLPKGIRVCPEGEGPAFRTLAPLVIPGGITVAEVAAEAELTGPRPNGLAPGSLTRIDPVIPGLSVTSTTSATGGTLLEEDEPYRARLLAAPARFSSAGSAGAYRFHALSASPDVLDALATSPSPLNVAVYVLAKGGLPSSDLLDQVRLALNADTVRPIADAVAVLPASRLPFRITAALTLLETADPVATLAQAQAAAQALVTNRRTALGRDVTPSQVQAALFVPGVYHVALTEPAVVLEVGASSFADCEAIQLTLAGVAHG